MVMAHQMCPKWGDIRSASVGGLGTCLFRRRVVLIVLVNVVIIADLISSTKKIVYDLKINADWQHSLERCFDFIYAVIASFSL